MKTVNSIMVVDDSEGDQYIMSRVIEDSKVTERVFSMRDGQEAVDFLADYEEKRREYGNGYPPGLILLDVNMPRLDGFAFLEEFAKLRAKSTRYGSVVVMMFTSSQDAEDKRRALAYDFVKDYLTKPVSEADIQRVVETHCQTPTRADSDGA